MIDEGHEPIPSKKASGIYIIRNKIDGKSYVGSASISLRSRITIHRRLMENGRHFNFNLNRAWSNGGSELLEFSVLEYCKPEDCISREQWWIDRIKPEYNLCKIAGSRKGTKHTAETKALWKNRPKCIHTESSKAKISKANKGKKYSAETRSKIAAARTGSKLSPETIDKIRRNLIGNKYNLGKRASPQARMNMSRAQMGRKQTPESIEKTRRAHIGKKRSPETRRAIGLGRIRAAKIREDLKYGNCDLFQGIY